MANNLNENLKYIVYCTINVVNKYIYVGVHQINSKHFDGYLGCAVYANQPSSYNHPKTKFQKAVQDYSPKNFKRITIKEFDNPEDAYDLERQIVDYDFLKREDVYNQVIGGKDGVWTYNAKPCYQYDLEGNFIAEYESQQKAAIAVNLSFSPIKYAIKYKTKSAGYFWTEYKCDKLNLEEFKTDTNKIPVFQYSESGEYDCCYESISDAARVNNTSSSNISRSCKLGYKENNKYFSYIFEENFTKCRTQNAKNQKVYQYSLNGHYISEYENCRQAELALGKSHGLSTAIKLGRVFAGYQWSLEKLQSMPKVVQKNKARKVGKYNLNNELIKIYNTVSECKKEHCGCQHVLHGKRKTSGGYIFKYID